jgi:hypothetical protein
MSDSHHGRDEKRNGREWESKEKPATPSTCLHPFRQILDYLQDLDHGSALALVIHGTPPSSKSLPLKASSPSRSPIHRIDLSHRLFGFLTFSEREAVAPRSRASIPLKTSSHKCGQL